MWRCQSRWVYQSSRHRVTDSAGSELFLSTASVKPGNSVTRVTTVGPSGLTSMTKTHGLAYAAW
jgi:hypothetical protein